MCSPKLSLLLSLAVCIVVFLSLSPTNAFGSVHDLHRILGCQKGDRVPGIYQVKRYLHHYGYLPSYSPLANGEIDDDIFDEKLEFALKTFQLYYNLEVTGTLNPQTLQQMSRPRCGVPDITNGVDPHGINPNYAYFPGDPKWPKDKTHFTYAFNPNGQPPIDINDVKHAVSLAFNSWTGTTALVFEEITDYNSADIKISFFSGEHGDSVPFDGFGKTTAHAFQPTIGWAHFDKDEKWGDVEKDTSTLDMESVAVHELGHILGMAHSSVPEAVMYAYLNYGVFKRALHTDDFDGIRALYGLPRYH